MIFGSVKTAPSLLSCVRWIQFLFLRAQVEVLFHRNDGSENSFLVHCFNFFHQSTWRSESDGNFFRNFLFLILCVRDEKRKSHEISHYIRNAFRGNSFSLFIVHVMKWVRNPIRKRQKFFFVALNTPRAFVQFFHFLFNTHMIMNTAMNAFYCKNYGQKLGVSWFVAQLNLCTIAAERIRMALKCMIAE